MFSGGAGHLYRRWHNTELDLSPSQEGILRQSLDHLGGEFLTQLNATVGAKIY